MEETSVNHVSDEGLVSKIYEELLKLNKKQTKTIRNQAKDLNGHFSKDIQNTNEDMKR